MEIQLTFSLKTSPPVAAATPASTSNWKTTMLGWLTGACLAAAAAFPPLAPLFLALAGIGHAAGGQMTKDK